MKRAIKIVSFAIGFCGFVFLACILLPDPYARAYQRSIVTQYDYYSGLGENKMVFIGSSSLSFGFDLDTMEALSGRSCAILGNHYGYGLSFLMEMSKSNLRSGDIVVVEMVDNSISTCGEDLLLTGIGHRYEMYRFFIPQTRRKIISYYPTYLKKTLMYDLDLGYTPEDGPYSIDAFDERGNMIYEREESQVPVPYKEDGANGWQVVSFSGDPYQEAFVEYFNEYVAWCGDRGAKVYITLPCFLRESVASPEEDIKAYEARIESSYACPLISKQADYFLDGRYIYNTNMHCTTEGAKLRTERLYGDLVRAGALA